MCTAPSRSTAQAHGRPVAIAAAASLLYLTVSQVAAPKPSPPGVAFYPAARRICRAKRRMVLFRHVRDESLLEFGCMRSSVVAGLAARPSNSVARSNWGFRRMNSSNWTRHITSRGHHGPTEGCPACRVVDSGPVLSAGWGRWRWRWVWQGDRGVAGGGGRRHHRVSRFGRVRFGGGPRATGVADGIGRRRRRPHHHPPNWSRGLFPGARSGQIDPIGFNFPFGPAWIGRRPASASIRGAARTAPAGDHRAITAGSGFRAFRRRRRRRVFQGRGHSRGFLGLGCSNRRHRLCRCAGDAGCACAAPGRRNAGAPVRVPRRPTAVVAEQWRR